MLQPSRSPLLWSVMTSPCHPTIGGRSRLPLRFHMVSVRLVRVPPEGAKSGLRPALGCSLVNSWTGGSERTARVEVYQWHALRFRVRCLGGATLSLLRPTHLTHTNSRLCNRWRHRACRSACRLPDSL